MSYALIQRVVIQPDAAYAGSYIDRCFRVSYYDLNNQYNIKNLRISVVCYACELFPYIVLDSTHWVAFI